MAERVLFKRVLKGKLDQWFHQHKVLIVYGARQVGKTTLAREIMDEHDQAVYLNCERQSVYDLLSSGNLERIRQHIGDSPMVILDEAQKIPDIGWLLKLLVDTYPDIQYLATGSSSFDLSNAPAEPLTGRNVKFIMYPLSLKELSGHYDLFQMGEMLESFMLYGSYPDIVWRGEKEKLVLLDELANDYLFRDVLSYEQIRKHDVIVNLLKALALQIGHEVSHRELSQLLKTSVETVQRYITLLEKSFVIFSLGAFSRNLRNEISKGRKYFFYDLGIRNSLLQNFAPLSGRSDVGQLWENFCIVERIKRNQELEVRSNLYFWRTYQQQEIDMIEESGGKLHAYEFKWRAKGGQTVPQAFRKAYPESTYSVIDQENYFDFLLK